MFKWFKKEKNKVVGTYDTSLLTRDSRVETKRPLYLGLTAVLVAVLIAVSVGIVPQFRVSPKSGLSLGYAEVVSAQGGTLDWYFTGANDNTKVASAIAALPATGGEVFILTPATGQSTINFSGTVSVPANVEIRGSGMGSSIVYNGSSPCFTSTGNGTTYENLKVDAGGIDTGATTGWLEINVAIGTTLYTQRSANSSLIDNAFTGNVTGNLTGNVSATTVGATTLNAPTGRTAYVIASSDAADYLKNQANVVANGSTDGTLINTTLATLGAGAVIQLVGKTFYIDTTIYPSANDQEIEASYDGRNWGLDGGSPGYQSNGTTLKLKNGANCDVIGKNPTTEYANFRLVGFSINGNGQHNSSGYGINVSGVGIITSYVGVFNCVSHGIYGDKTGEGVYPWLTACDFSYTASRFNGGAGIWIQNYSADLQFEVIWTDGNVGDGCHLVNVAPVINEWNTASTAGYGFYFNGCTSGELLTGLQDESSPLGDAIVNCTHFNINSITISGAGDTSGKCLQITGTMWANAGNDIKISSLSINSGTNNITGIYTNGITFCNIAGSIWLSGSGAVIGNIIGSACSSINIAAYNSSMNFYNGSSNYNLQFNVTNLNPSYAGLVDYPPPPSELLLNPGFVTDTSAWLSASANISVVTPPLAAGLPQTSKYGANILQIIGNGGGYSQAHQDLPSYASYAGLKVTLSFWYFLPSANVHSDAYYFVMDGTNNFGNPITTKGAWTFVTYDCTITAVPTKLSVSFVSNQTGGANTTDYLFISAPILTLYNYSP